MKTNIIALFIFLFTLNAFSQHKDRERIKALKISFITSKLDLTSKEAQEFWPVYNAYDEATLKIKHQDIRNIRREIKQNLNTLSEDKAKELLNKLVIAENKLHEEKVNLIEKLKKIISPKKIIVLKAAEDDFNRQLFDQYKRKRLQNRN
tara:strand:- start:8354 stop:8800 length:447 start_codon:yes stop_codon:yes gene_type:complete